MKSRLVWKLGHRIDRDLTLASVSLAVAIGIRETDLLNAEGSQRLLRILFRQAWRNEFIAAGLRENEPARLVHKAREGAVAILSFVVRCFFIANLASNRHAER